MSMNDPCPEAAKLEYFFTLPDDDPQRKHVDQCARCRALWKSYRAFITANELPAEARATEADQKLSAFLVREIGESDDQPILAVHPPQDRTGQRWWMPIRLTPTTGLLAAAVLVVAIGLGSFLFQNDGQLNQTLQRGDRTSPTRIYPAGTAVVSDTGDMTLTWSEMTGAISYQVVLFDADLVEFQRLEPVPGITMILAAEVLAKQANPVFWTVVGLVDNRELARTRTSALPAR